MFQDMIFEMPGIGRLAVCIGYIESNVFLITLDDGSLIEAAFKEMSENPVIQEVKYATREIIPFNPPVNHIGSPSVPCPN